MKNYEFRKVKFKIKKFLARLEGITVPNKEIDCLEIIGIIEKLELELEKVQDNYIEIYEPCIYYNRPNFTIADVGE